MEAAIINGVDIVAGRTVSTALRVHVEREITHLLKVKEIARFLQHAGVGVEAQKIQQTEGYQNNSFSFFANATSGVFLIHLQELDVVDHIIIVDENRKLIFDSTEQYPMSFSQRLLLQCGGEEAANFKIVTARRLVNQVLNHSAQSVISA